MAGAGAYWESPCNRPPYHTDIALYSLYSMERSLFFWSKCCTHSTFCLHPHHSSKGSLDLQSNSLSGWEDVLWELPKTGTLEQCPWIAKLLSFDGVPRSWTRFLPNFEHILWSGLISDQVLISRDQITCFSDYASAQLLMLENSIQIPVPLI